MRKIWTERQVPAEFMSLFEGRAILVGAADPQGRDPMETLAEAEGIIASARVKYNAELFAQAPALRVVCRSGIGYDNCSLEDATAAGIAVCNVPDGPSVSTAEHTMALLLMVAKNLKQTSLLLNRPERGDFFTPFTGVELDGLTMGLVGLGRIGGRVARIAQGFGMHVIAFDPYCKPEVARAVGAELAGDLDELLAKSDVVSLHLPLSPETRHLLDAKRIAGMKRGAILLNAARGGLIDEAALLDALKSGHVRGAGLDVFENEPPPPDNPLLALPNVVATPHIAAATEAGKRRLWSGAVEQVFSVLEGVRPPHLLNPEVWQLKAR